MGEEHGGWELLLGPRVPGASGDKWECCWVHRASMPLSFTGVAQSPLTGARTLARVPCPGVPYPRQLPLELQGTLTRSFP